MGEQGLISVIIPVYKVEDYLEKCIRSVVSNVYKKLEIICIDDGSPDRCGMILNKLAEEDSRIIAVHQENQGVSAARNKGLELATGEYIAFVDSDDYIHPLYFKSMMNCMQQTGADLVVCSAEKVDEDTKLDFPEYTNIQYHKLSANDFFKSYYARHMVWGKIYRRKHIGNHHFTSEVRYGDDTLYNLQVLHDMEKPVVYETNTPLYYYLMRASSIVHSGSIERSLDFGKWYDDNRTVLIRNKSGWQWMLPMQSIKMTLSYRYSAKIAKYDHAMIKEADRILRVSYKDIFKDSAVSWEQKILHAVMIAFPGLYRRFRIKNDPTLIEWEKSFIKKVDN